MLATHCCLKDFAELWSNFVGRCRTTPHFVELPGTSSGSEFRGIQNFVAVDIPLTPGPLPRGPEGEREGWGNEHQLVGLIKKAPLKCSVSSLVICSSVSGPSTLYHW